VCVSCNRVCDDPCPLGQAGEVMGQRGRAGSMIIASLYTSHLVLLGVGP